MASDTKTQVIKGGHYLRLSWSSVADPNTNTSLVTLNLYYGLSYSTSSIAIGSRSDAKMTYDGVDVGFIANAINFSGIGERLLGTTQRTISHNPDGSKTLSIAATYPMRATLDGTYFASVVISDSALLDTIPRASQPTVSPTPVELGGVLSIQTHRASSSFTHTLEYTFGNQSGVIVENLPTDYDWTVPLTLANAIPNATSGSGIITCKTYNGATLIGTKTVAFTANVPTSVVPVINSVNITEAVAGLAAKFLAYVQNKSKLAVATSASGAYSSTITQIKVTIENTNYTGASITSDIITGSGTISVVILVTDSRGRTKSQTVNVTVVVYTNPAINAMNAYRVNGSGTPMDDGTSIAIPMNFLIASVNNRNNKTWLLEYRIVGAPSWTTLSSGSVYTYNATYTNLTGLFSGDNSYEIRLTITDYFTSISRIVSIGTAFALYNINASGKGWAFGKVSEGDNLEVALDAYFTGLLKKNGYDVATSLDIDTIMTTLANKLNLTGGTLTGNLTAVNLSSQFGLVQQKAITDGNGLPLGNIPSGNADLAIDTGWYNYTTGNSNTPDTYGSMLVLERTSTIIFQLAFGSNGKMFHRSTIDGGSTWTAWQTLWTNATTRTRFTQLWTGTLDAANEIGTLSEAYSNFDFLIVVGFMDNASSENMVSVEIPVGTISTNVRRYTLNHSYTSASVSYVHFSFPSTTQIRVDSVSGAYVEAIRYVYGVKL